MGIGVEKASRDSWTALDGRMCRVHGEEKRLDRSVRLSATVHRNVSLEHLEVEFSFMKLRRTGERPLEGECPVVILNVAVPELVSVEVVGGKIAGAAEKEDRFPVRDRGTAGKRASLVVASTFTELLRPNHFARLGIDPDTHDTVLFLVDGGEEDRIVPDDRSGSTFAGELGNPGHVFGLGESGRQPGFL
jgi:hypothetical protein